MTDPSHPPARPRARRFPVRAAVVLAALVALAAPPWSPTPASFADESGPNFEVPERLSTAVRERYAAAVERYRAADKATEGQTRLAEAAAEELRQVAKAATDFAPPRYYLGIIYQWTKEYERARAVLVQAVQINPRFHEAHVELGDTWQWLGKPERARPSYDKAIEVAPGYALAWLRRGQLRIRVGDFAGAQQDLAEAAARATDPRMTKQAEAYLKICAEEIEGPRWERTYTAETANYRVLTPVDQELAEFVARHAELINKTYRRVFPAISRDKRKFPIIVYGSKEEYHKNGGPAGAGGHYSPLVRKLVLFKYPKERDTLIVLYHEAFHQFLHDYLEDAPQWMDEGLGDFFGPCEYVEVRNARGRVLSEGMRFRVNPWRLRTIQQAVRQSRVRGWRELMLMSQKELYEPQWAGIHYAQAWSIIYFLIRSGARDDEISGPYFKLLSAYFDRLRKGDGQEGAFDAAFGRVDLPKIEEEWKAFVLGLKESD